MDRATIILVHGFWGGAMHWSKVIPHLVKEGYTVQAVENPLTSFKDDVARTVQMIDQAEDDVILVGHSYGGAVITEAGNNPKVKALVYIAAFAPDRGESAGSISEQKPAAAIPNVVEDSDGYLWVGQEKFHESFCQDIDREEATVLAVTQKAPQAETFAGTVKSPAWKVKPSYYQVSTEDRMISPENQRIMAERMQPVKRIELNSSHVSPVSHAPEVAQLIVQAAQEQA